jgi:UDP-N-acetylmuramate dehydrogenase
MSAWTRYRIGGPAARFAVVDDRADLRDALSERDGRRCRVVGGGANVLVADRGVEDAVVKLGEAFDYIRGPGESGLEAGAAAGLPALVGVARRNALEGWVFLEAVPGTVGGGLRMNAGSRDAWLWDRVTWAEAVTPGGDERRLTPEEAEPVYRGVGVPEGWIFVRARFEAREGDPGEVERAHLEFRRRKVEAQVYDRRSVGSIWKNPGDPHGSAWEVVDRVGMRGGRRGGAQVSEKHANFIVNTGDARAEDVLGLMAETRSRARDELGVELVPEIRLWGFTREELRSVGALPRGDGPGAGEGASGRGPGGGDR